MKILYADDDPMMQKYVAYLLIRYGHEVTTVDDGTEALSALNEEEFDLILLDILMPRLSGIEVLQQIRKKYGHQHKIIMVSRNEHFAALKKAIEYGADDFIHKPFEPDKFLLKIKKLIGRAAD